MLLQSMLTMAVMVVLAGALLTSALVSAKVAMHETATRLIGIALDGGTGDVTTWAADFVYRHTASGPWPTTEQTSQSQPICEPSSSSGMPAGLAPSLGPGPCSRYATVTYRITGSTSFAASAGDEKAATDAAENLQVLVDEQRISAEVTATITNNSGVVLGSGTRQLTLRVFDAPPWAIVTGTRDVSTVLGPIDAVEGDTAGTKAGSATGQAKPDASPDPNDPSGFKDTTIKVTMTCSNSAGNDDQEAPFRDNQEPGNYHLPWGVQLLGRAYEAPCQPKYAFAANPGIPADADVPTDGNYQIGAFSGATAWHNGYVAPAGGWPQ
jgi:hypothetical protein